MLFEGCSVEQPLESHALSFQNDVSIHAPERRDLDSPYQSGQLDLC
jgi:hypothetical protein